jgi:hypothetical protein
MTNYVNFADFDAKNINFSLGAERNNKPVILMSSGPTATNVALVSPACVTNWPRVSGDGNFGTMWGPTDVYKSKYTLDLTDQSINGASNDNFNKFTALLEEMDDRLLDFVQANQQRVLNRKNLSRDEIKMLQIRSVRPKYDRASGNLQGYTVQLSTSKFVSDGCGGKFNRQINICDHSGTVVANACVQPGDIVAATMYANQVYTGVGGDKFGIHWSFEDVQVVCQRSRLAQKTAVPCFNTNTYEFAMPYEIEQFSNEIMQAA